MHLLGEPLVRELQPCRLKRLGGKGSRPGDLPEMSGSPPAGAALLAYNFPEPPQRIRHHTGVVHLLGHIAGVSDDGYHPPHVPHPLETVLHRPQLGGGRLATLPQQGVDGASSHVNREWMWGMSASGRVFDRTLILHCRSFYRQLERHMARKWHYFQQRCYQC